NVIARLGALPAPAAVPKASVVMLVNGQMGPCANDGAASAAARTTVEERRSDMTHLGKGSAPTTDGPRARIPEGNVGANPALSSGARSRGLRLGHLDALRALLLLLRLLVRLLQRRDVGLREERLVDRRIDVDRED